MLLPHIKHFYKTKIGLELVYLPHFLKNNIFVLCSMNNHISGLVAFTLRSWAICVLQPGCDVINFEINPIFLIKLFFLPCPKNQDKNFNILRTKRAFKTKYKAFFIIFKRAFIDANKTNFLGRSKSNFNSR